MTGRGKGAAGPILLLAFLLLTACAVPGAEGQADLASAMMMSPQDGSEPRASRGRPPLDAVNGPWVCSESRSPSLEPTLFVAPDGSGSNDGTRENRPLATLQQAADRAGPGDVVWVREGIYETPLTLTTSGTEREPIVFESYPGECAILDGSSLAEGRMVTFENVEHVTFRHFVVRGAPAEGIYLTGSDQNVLSHLRVHGNRLSGITNQEGDENLFSYVISYDNADRNGQDADGISISSGDRNHVAYCVTYENSDDGVDTWRSTGTLVERCLSFRNGGRSGDGMGIKAGGRSPSAGTVVRRSIAFENRSHGFDYNTGRDVVFERNTAFGNGGYGFVAGGSTLRGNLSVENGSGAWYRDDDGGEIVDNAWDLDVGAEVLVGSAPGAPDFLSLSEAAPEVGALAEGETLEEAFGIDLAALLDE